MDEDHPPDHNEVRLEAAIPQRELFAREQSAQLEGPQRAWDLAVTTIDFGAALLMAWNAIRPDHQLFDAVIAALLRRALVTAEGARVLLAAGLLEPAIAQSRTLLEIELALRLIYSDSSGLMAKRLAAYHYLTYQRHGQDQLADPGTRRRAVEADRVKELAQISGSYKRLLELPIFDEVRKEVKSKRNWHGYDSVQAAFAASGASPDYFMLYDAQTWFVHAVNVDFDYADRTDTELSLKALIERDPAVIQVQLGHVLLRLVTIFGMIAANRGYPTASPFDHMSIVRLPDESTIEITALDALTSQLAQLFKGEG